MSLLTMSRLIIFSGSPAVNLNRGKAKIDGRDFASVLNIGSAIKLGFKCLLV